MGRCREWPGGRWPRPDRTAFGARSDEGFEEVARQLGEFLAGETTIYGEFARSLGAGTEPRDVGAAVGRNPLCIIITCHRVVGATGRLTGYAGGLYRKRALLEIEHAGASVVSP